MGLDAYQGLFIFFGLMVLAGLVFLALTHLVQIRVKADKYDWTRPYECGIATDLRFIGRFPVHYYLVGVFFVIFDVETIFLVPWALAGNQYRANGDQLFWFMVMLPFFFVLVLGYVYDVLSGVLEWGRQGDSAGRSGS